MSHQSIGVHDGHKLMEQIWLGHKELWSELLHYIFQLLGSVPWNSIPGFWLTPVNYKSKSICNTKANKMANPFAFLRPCSVRLSYKGMFKPKKHHQKCDLNIRNAFTPASIKFKHETFHLSPSPSSHFHLTFTKRRPLEFLKNTKFHICY